jgi:hypothetical protein
MEKAYGARLRSVDRIGLKLLGDGGHDFERAYPGESPRTLSPVHIVSFHSYGIYLCSLDQFHNVAHQTRQTCKFLFFYLTPRLHQLSKSMAASQQKQALQAEGV